MRRLAPEEKGEEIIGGMALCFSFLKYSRNYLGWYKMKAFIDIVTWILVGGQSLFNWVERNTFFDVTIKYKDKDKDTVVIANVKR